MRTTLTLADDAFLYAKRTAARDNISLSEAVTRLVRAGARTGLADQSIAAPFKGKYSLLPARGEVVTSTHVRTIMDESDI